VHARAVRFAWPAVVVVVIYGVFAISLAHAKKASIPDINGNWTGSTTNSHDGTQAFTAIFDQQVGKSKFVGSYEIGGGGSEGASGPLSGSVITGGKITMTLSAPSPNHSKCTADATAHLSNDATEISGSYKLSNACKQNERGNTGTFELTF
jgi:hypothetical protein